MRNICTGSATKGKANAATKDRPWMKITIPVRGKKDLANKSFIYPGAPRCVSKRIKYGAKLA